MNYLKGIRQMKNEEQIYKEHSTTKAKPDAFITNLDDLRKLWGDEAVNRGLADGTIRILDTEDDTEETSKED
jgi:hypothetical protein